MKILGISQIGGLAQVLVELGRCADGVTTRPATGE